VGPSWGVPPRRPLGLYLIVFSLVGAQAWFPKWWLARGVQDEVPDGGTKMGSPKRGN
jgi:hypothetical protein